ncbi:LysR family transcriptional regulator [Polaromonas sp. A23]|uniref:LysR family transcriptional regulator n=1 Tax=Polaromonas sp. A23 TaxID=1944133 RepID=UPI000985FB76|nr:LysR family transcriptional regulator [Polaromonas sp. A23]OOG43884.1 LysR family transcriptional regulator [Polaromonas sp. A23]
MNLRQLEVFQAVMQTGNMSAAARLICITPSAVSKTISHTELQLGYKLFTRAKGTLAPTPEARVLFEESTLIHRKLDELKRIAVNLRQADGGQIRLAAIPSISHEFLPLVLEKHMARHPRVSVEVRTLHQDQMVQALLTRSVDFALGFYEHPHPLLTSTMQVTGPLYLCVTRDIWQRAVRARRQNPMTFLSSMPLVRLVGEDPMCQSIDELARNLGLTASANLQVHTSRLALELVKRGMGWTVVDFLTASNLDTSTLTAVPLHDFAPIALYLYFASSTPPGQDALRMLDMLPGLLHQVMGAGITAD